MQRDALYKLLPAVYRNRDGEHGEALRALLGVMETELARFDASLTRLYDDWFIETCSEWVAPYIGELLGPGRLDADDGALISRRALVANTIALRRRKGALPVVEKAARSLTGWNARAVEHFRLLSRAANLNQSAAANAPLVDLRQADLLNRIGGPFDATGRTANLRSAAAGALPTLDGVGLYLWPLPTYRLTAVHASPADAVGGAAAGRYYCHPGGGDANLFNAPRSPEDAAAALTEINLPAPLRPLALKQELDHIRSAVRDGRTPTRVFFSDESPALLLQLAVSDDPAAPWLTVRPEEIDIADLANWSGAPETTLTTSDYAAAYELAPAPGETRPIVVAFDPTRGRLAFTPGFRPAGVRASFSWAFIGDIGGGAYDRTPRWRATLPDDWDADAPDFFHVGVSATAVAAGDERICRTLPEAIELWNALAPGARGVITILDSASYETGATPIQIPEGAFLSIVAADWPVTDAPAPAHGGRRALGRIVPSRRWPALRGDLQIIGTANAASATPGGFSLNGVIITGDLRVVAGHLGRCDIADCTAPTGGEVAIENNPDLQARIAGCVVRAVKVPGASLQIDLTECVLYDSALALSAPEAHVQLKSVTVLGAARMHSVEASDCLFVGEVSVSRRQIGCMRYSYFPDASRTPRAFQCQPQLALQRLQAELDASGASAAERSALYRIERERLRPAFLSRRYGDPAFARLSRRTAVELRSGAENGSAMGAAAGADYRRELQLRAVLPEYVRFGRTLGTYFMDQLGEAPLESER